MADEAATNAAVEDVSTQEVEAQETEETTAADDVQDDAQTVEEDSTEEVSEESDTAEEDDSDTELAKTLKNLKKKNSENQNLRKRAITAESKLLRYEAAEAAGLSLNHAKRLVGETKEELIKDAEELAAQLNPSSKLEFTRSEGREGAGSKNEDVSLTSLGEQIYNRGN